MQPDGHLFRPRLERVAPAWALAAAIFVVHAIIRFGGLWDARFFPLSMAIIWPLPWLLSPGDGRRGMGIRAPRSWHWFWIGPLVAVIVLAVCAASGWLAFGGGDANWFVRHGEALQEILARVPAGGSAATLFWIVTVPAMIFSPLGEEFLYRGFMLRGFADRWGDRAGMVVQAAAFALVHLAHYGLRPLQPALIALWVPSMFVAALALGWIVRRSGSLWPAVVAHSAFNLGMNGIVFVLLPDVIRVS